MEEKIAPQNLIRQVKVDFGNRAATYKPIIFDSLTVLSAFSLGYAYSQFLGGKLTVTNLALILGVFAIFSTLQVFFTRNLSRRFSILILETAAILASFYKYDVRILAAAAAVLIVFIFWGDAEGYAELENGLEIRFFKTSKLILKKFTTATVLALVLLYLPQWNQRGVFVSQESFGVFFDWAAGVASGLYPEINFNSSFGKLTESLSRLELQNSSALKDLTPAEKENMINRTAEQVAENLSKSLGVKISPNEPVSEAFYNFILKVLNDWRGRFQNWFVVGWALAVFFILRSFGTIFYWITAFISFIFYQILVSLGFVHIAAESRTHEVIEY